MGFSLQIGPTDAYIAERDAVDFARFLAEMGVSPNERVDPSLFPPPFFALGSYEQGGPPEFVFHMETGWSWWSKTQRLIAELLSPDSAPHSQGIHAVYGVAIPADLEPSMLGTPIPRTDSVDQNSLPPGTPHEVATQIARMMMLYGGPNENLYMVSGPRLLEEMELALQRSGLSGADPVELYQNLDDQNDLDCARCYLIMSHRFLKAGISAGHLVWWVK